MTAFRRLLAPVLKLMTAISILSVTCAGYPHRAIAVEQLTLRLGLLQQTIDIAELETFAKTGELSPRLKPYRVFLTPSVREVLQKHLHVDPFIADRFLEDLFRSSDGEQLLEQLNAALPNSTPQQLKTTLSLTLNKTQNLSILSFLKAYPTENLTLNLTAIAGIAAQLNKTTLQSRILNPRLIDDLAIEDKIALPNNFSPEQVGNQRVFKKTKVFKDSHRKRYIPVDIYYTDRSQGPLIVMSHGFAADRRFLHYLAYHLASQGLTVVSVEHPGSNIESLVQISAGIKLSHAVHRRETAVPARDPNSTGQLLPASEFVERPKDISFVIDRLEELNRAPDFLRGKFNTHQVSIIGHSFGGYTALALAGAELNPQAVRQSCQKLSPLSRSPSDWLQCAAAELPYKKVAVKDRRIVQAIVLNPIVGNLFDRSLSAVTIPVLMLASTEDGITPPLNHQLQSFQQLQGEKYLLVAAGATHMSVTDISYLNSTMGQSTLVREVMDDKAEPVRKVVRGISLAFIQQLTPQAQAYQPYLSSNYVQSLSSQQIRLRLTKNLPSSVKTVMGLIAFNQSKVTLDTAPSKPSWIEQVKECIANIEGWFSPPEYHTEQLESVFSDLLEHSYQELDNLS